MFRLRRSLLFAPGNDPHKMGKAAATDADSIVLDLEDAVAATQKDRARLLTRDALGNLDFGRSERLVRVNSPNTGLLMDDLRVTIQSRPDGYVIPKIETREQVESIDDYLGEEETRQGRPRGSTILLALIETARGIVNLDAISSSSGRLQALILGAEDLAVDIGARRTPEGWEILYARSAIVTAAAARRLQPIDTVFVDLHDLPGLEAESLFARQLGFEGKLAIHPCQIEVIHRALSPSPEEIEEAQKIVREHAIHESEGTGAFELGGRMVDLPIVRAAEYLLWKARSAGLLD